MNNSDDNGYFHQHCFSLSFPFKQIKQYKYIGLLIFYLILVTHIV